MGKDAFIATNFVLVPITSLSQGPMSQGPRSQGPWSQVLGLSIRVSDLRVPGPRSQRSGLGSQVLILDYANSDSFDLYLKNECDGNIKREI